MPFDGVDFRTGCVVDTGIFPKWRWDAWRFWLKSRRARKAEIEPVARSGAVVQLLENAKMLIGDQHQWVQGTYSRLPDKRCAIGALRSAARQFDDISLAWSAHALLIQVASSRHFSSVENMNDHSSHKEVLHAFDEAIAFARTRMQAVPRAAPRAT
jgi:hypothetical protein